MSKIVARIYTIHDKSRNKMYTVKHSASSKTMLVSFRRDVDAIRVARLMEIHRSIHDSLPENICDASFDTSNDTWHPCRELFIRSWSEFSLKEYCKNNNIETLSLACVPNGVGGFHLQGF